ncbi:MAG: ComEA family DNA-binding protein [Actinomycetaceae bacterium]|nr:ComEA family DNA-binding protein [Actinomycetaceae bacterium]
MEQETLVQAAWKAAKARASAQLPEKPVRVRWQVGPAAVFTLGLVIAAIAVVTAFGRAPATTPMPVAKPAPQVVVHVVGQVNKPGLQKLRRGARVADAIESAGGAKADAKLDALNLAQPLSDGTQIVVPAQTPKSAGQSAAESAQSNCINLNSAPPEKLQELSGIGPALATRIEKFRQKTPFSKVSDLQQVPGIGPSIVGKVEGEACV